MGTKDGGPHPRENGRMTTQEQLRPKGNGLDNGGHLMLQRRPSAIDQPESGQEPHSSSKCKCHWVVAGVIFASHRNMRGRDLGAGRPAGRGTTCCPKLGSFACNCSPKPSDISSSIAVAFVAFLGYTFLSGVEETSHNIIRALTSPSMTVGGP